MFFKRASKSKLNEAEAVVRDDFIKETKEELQKLLQKKDLFQLESSHQRGSSETSSTNSNNSETKTKKTLRRSLSLPSARRVRSIAQVPQAFTPTKTASKNVNIDDTVRLRDNVFIDGCNKNTSSEHQSKINFDDIQANVDLNSLKNIKDGDSNLKDAKVEICFEDREIVDNKKADKIRDGFNSRETTRCNIRYSENENSMTTGSPLSHSTDKRLLVDLQRNPFPIVENGNSSSIRKPRLSKQVASTDLIRGSTGNTRNFVVVTKTLNIHKGKIMNQADSYLTWVNSQLNKRPNSRHVDELSKDMNDGVVFLQLVEVISNTKQDIIDHDQLSIKEMQQNLNGVIQFLSNNNVRVHHILPKEIIEGNIKTIMRLVLALAAHFKPDLFNYHTFNSTSTPIKSMRRTPNSLVQRTPSIISLASEAAASLAEASKNASKGGSSSLSHKYRNHQHFDNVTPKASKNSAYLANSSRSFTMPHGTESTPPTRLTKARAESCDPRNARPRSLRLNSADIPDLSQALKPGKRAGQLSVTEFPVDCSEIKTRTRTVEDNTCADPNSQSVKRVLIPEGETSENEEDSELMGLHVDLMDEITDAKEVLEQLQTVLLNGRTTDEMHGLDTTPSDETFQEQLVVKNIMLENIETECHELRNQMSEFKEINMRLTSEKHGLELRSSQQEQLILSLKSRLLEYEHPKRPRNSEQELNALLQEKSKELHLLHQELAKRDKIIEKQKTELDKMSHDIVGKKRSEANLYARIESSESMVSNLQMQLREATENMQLQTGDVGRSQQDDASMKMQEAKIQKFKQKISREHRNLAVTLNNIRGNFPKDDPVQHALQSMDHSLVALIDASSLIDTINNVKALKHPPNVGVGAVASGGGSGNNGVPSRTSSKGNRSSLPKQRASKTKSIVSSDSGYDHNANVSLDAPSEQLKIVYFLGKSVTPILKTSDIGLGYLTLRDFKELVNRPGKYRYFFKSKDKDFGFVREELLFEDDVVPGFENKVVSWIERNLGEEV